MPSTDSPRRRHRVSAIHVATSTADREEDAVHVEGPEVAARRARDRREQPSADHRRRSGPASSLRPGPADRTRMNDKRADRRCSSQRSCQPRRVRQPRSAAASAAHDRARAHDDDAHDDGADDHDDHRRRRRPPRRRRPRPTTDDDAVPTGGTSATQNGSLGSCPVFPADNAWNRDVVGRCPVDTNSAQLPRRASPPSAATRSCTPTSVATARTASRTSPCRARSRSVPDQLHRLRRRERPRPVPDPADAPVEGGERRATCSPSTATTASSTSCSARSPWRDRWDGERRARCSTCTSNALRPDGWTSADAAGLADLPRARALRRGGERAHRPRAALHRVAQTQRGVHPPGDALGVVEHRRQPARRWACACG